MHLKHKFTTADNTMNMEMEIWTFYGIFLCVILFPMVLDFFLFFIILYLLCFPPLTYLVFFSVFYFCVGISG